MTDKSFIFLAGHHRSGTSLLHEIIKEHPLISGFSNTGVPEDEGMFLQNVYEPAKTYGGPGKYIFDKNSHMDENHPLATVENANSILQQWEKYYDKNCPYYVEKSPPNIVRTRFLQKLYPNSRFIFIFRHPLAVSYATRKWSKTRIKSLIEHTLRGYEILLNDISHLNNAYILRYEDFVLSPQETINNVFNFLDLETVNVEHEIRPDVNEKYFSTWEEERKRLISRIRFPISNKVEKRVNALGYSLLDYRELKDVSFLGVHNTLK
tara:strand:- start:161 stop:955 length:795 start_codon:yes stop_codon:yes gene_type:complete